VLGQQLGDQRHPRAEFAGQPHPGQKAQHRVLLHVDHEGVGEIGQRVERDGRQQREAPTHAIPHHAPEEAADQHADHLQVEQRHTPVGVVLAGDAELSQRAHAHHAEDDDVVQIHKVTERRGGDGQHEQRLLAEVHLRHSCTGHRSPADWRR
jgi:hypothetical protein